MKKRFLSYPKHITWPGTILFAVFCALLTAVLNLVPVFQGTSLQNIAVNLECWILFALFVVTGCKKWWEAALKCFVFFLISQPLIYLIEVPFLPIGWGVFQYYRHWFILTLFTLPGGAAAFFVKKKNLLSVLILSGATAFLAYQAVTYFWTVRYAFPKDLISCIFCLALAVFLILWLLRAKKHRIAAFAILLCALFASVVLTLPESRQTIVLPDGEEWQYSTSDDTVVSVEIGENGTALLSSRHDGNALLTFSSGEEILEYDVTVGAGTLMVSRYS